MLESNTTHTHTHRYTPNYKFRRNPTLVGADDVYSVNYLNRWNDLANIKRKAIRCETTRNKSTINLNKREFNGVREIDVYEGEFLHRNCEIGDCELFCASVLIILTEPKLN